MDEDRLNDILFPKPKRRRKTRSRKRSGRGFMKLLLGLVVLLVVLGGIFSVADIGGNIILGLAQNYLSENLGLSLTAESITGNPVKGYVLNNFELADTAGQKILSADFLSGRMNFPALLTGKVRLAEISLGGMSMDIDTLTAALKNLKLPEPQAERNSKFTITASPAFAEDNGIPDIPVDMVKVVDSTFTSAYGVLTVNEIGADLKTFDINVDGKINDIPVNGTIDMGESAGLTAMNRSDINLGSGKVLATGGYIYGNLDLHVSLENLNLQEMTGLYPAMLKPEDFSGIASVNIDITGEPASPIVFGAIDYKGTKIYGFPVERLSSNINYSDYRAAFTNIQASAFNVPVQGEIAAAMRPNEKLSVMIKLDGSEANLDGLDKILGIPELKDLSGKVAAFNANINGRVDELSGIVNFTAPRIAYTGRAITDIRAQMKLSKSDSASVDGKFRFEGAQGYIQGKVDSVLTGAKLDVTAKIVDLDVKRVENMIPDASDYKLAGKITASVNVKGSANNPAVTGSLNSPEFSGFDQKITKPVVNFTYADKTLTLRKTEGTLNGMPINLSGTISPIPSESPNLNINATISLTPDALKTYVPDIASYNLKGTVNAGMKVQGSIHKPSVNLVASSANLQAMDILTAKDIELTTALNGDITKLDRININAAAKSITASGITFSGVNANITKNGDKIILGGLNAQNGAGTITGSGTADITGKSPLDFNFKFAGLALASLASASGLDVKGNLSGTLKISGANTNPAMTLNAEVPSLSAQGFTFSNLLADISGNMTALKLNKLRAQTAGAEVSASGNVQISPAVKLDVAVKGDSIQLERLLPDYKDSLTGTASLSINITGTGDNIAAKGTLTSPALKAFGINLTNVNLPLSYSGNNFASAGGTAKLYNGTLKNTLTFDMKAMKFTDNIDASGVDVNALIQDVSGGLEGKITGAGRLSMKITGTTKDKVTYSGSGNFSMGAGAVTGFKWLDLVSKIHSTNGIKYTSVNAPLSLQTGRLILRAGSIANAPKNDPMYRYAKISQNGTINFSGKDVMLNLPIEAVINYQLINALQGGSKGGLEALFKGGVSNWQDGLGAFLSGGISGAEKAGATGDFRTVTLKVSGKAKSPSVSNLRIGASTLKQQTTEMKIQSADKKPNTKDLKEQIIDRAIDAIAPGIKKQTTTTAPANSSTKSQPQQSKSSAQPAAKNQQSGSQKQNARQQIEDKVKEELQKRLPKGLGGLFK